MAAPVSRTIAPRFPGGSDLWGRAVPDRRIRGVRDDKGSGLCRMWIESGLIRIGASQRPLFAFRRLSARDPKPKLTASVRASSQRPRLTRKPGLQNRAQKREKPCAA